MAERHPECAERVADLLAAARRRLARDGWVQRRWHGLEGGLCVSQALIEEVRAGAFSIAEMAAAEGRLHAVICGDPGCSPDTFFVAVVEWNDAAGTTCGDVLAALALAAVGCSREPVDGDLDLAAVA